MSRSGDSHGDSGGAVPATADEARRQLERQANTDVGRTINSLVRREGNGNIHFLGMEFGPEYENIIGWGKGLLQFGTIDQMGPHAFGGTYKLVSKIPGLNRFAAPLATAAEVILVGGAALIEPIAEEASAITAYRKAYHQVFKELEPVIDRIKASGGNWKDNAIVQEAIDRAWDNFMADNKLIWSDAPKIAAMGALAGDKLMNAGPRRVRQIEEFKAQQKVQQHLKSNPGMTHNELRIAEELRIQDEVEKIREKLREKFFEADGKTPKTKSFRTVEEFDTHFNEKLYNKYWDAVADAKPEAAQTAAGAQTMKDMVLRGVAVGSGMISPITEASARRIINKQKNEPTTWDLIKHLDTELENLGRVSHESLKNEIVKILDRSEKYRIGTGLGEAQCERLLKDGALDKVVEYIADGRLKAYSLALLADDIIIHDRTGRHFASAQKIEEAIEKLLPAMSAREPVTFNEFLADFANPQAVRKTIKDGLEKFEGTDKAIYASMFSDEMLKEVGWKKSEIDKARQEGHSGLYNVVAAGIMELAQKDEAEQKAMGLSSREIEAVQQLDARLQSQGVEAVKEAVDKGNTDILSAARKVVLNGERPWSERVKESGSVQETLKKIVGGNQESRSQEADEGYDEAPENRPTRRLRKDEAHAGGPRRHAHGRRSHEESGQHAGRQ